MEERNIIDNMFLAQKLIRGYGRKRISPRCILMVDIRKAFDTLSWKFMKNILTGFGLPSDMTSWILECVTTASFSISINGKFHGFFKGKRGLRQGDPLSPYLFILAMEFFSRLLKFNTDNSDFKFHPKCGSLKITYLAFADDVMLFSIGDIASVSILMQTLNHFQ